MENNKLLHSGIKGMRWGVRRWQNKDGSLTPAGRERYADTESDEERKQREEAEKAYREEAKNRAMKSGDVNQVRRWQSEMTNKELEDAIKRIDLRKQVEESDPSYVSGKDKAKRAVDTLDNIKKGGETLVGIYNVVAKINNTFNKKFKLTGISDDLIKTVNKYGEELDKQSKQAGVDKALAEAEKAFQESERSRIEREKSSVELERKQYEFERQKKADEEADKKKKQKEKQDNQS